MVMEVVKRKSPFFFFSGLQLPGGFLNDFERFH